MAEAGSSRLNADIDNRNRRLALVARILQEAASKRKKSVPSKMKLYKKKTRSQVVQTMWSSISQTDSVSQTIKPQMSSPENQDQIHTEQEQQSTSDSSSEDNNMSNEDSESEEDEGSMSSGYNDTVELDSEDSHDEEPTESVAESTEEAVLMEEEADIPDTSDIDSEPEDSKSKLLACGVCKKRFTRVGLRQHMIIHSEKRHKCDICKRAFRHEAYFKIHMMQHTGERTPFHCDYCDRSCASRANLKEHVVRKHPLELIKLFPI